MTTPSGKLAWGQAGAYDAIDDRAVIRAVTGGRTGNVVLPVITSGSGLNLTLKGGWLAVVDCGDGTSSVIASRTDSALTALVGPASGSRTDYIWADVQPDSGTWSLSVINATAAAGRTGIALASIVVPANATLVSQMTITPTDPLLERRLLGYSDRNETNVRTANAWNGAQDLCSCTVMNLPGRWYRVRFVAASPCMQTGGPDMRASVGVCAGGSPLSTAVVQKTVAIPIISAGRPVSTICELTYQWPVGSAAASRQWTSRLWITGSGSYRTALIVDQGMPLVLTVEDLGS